MTFPGFIDLQDENDVDPDFYESSNMVTDRPRPHWCFLGEILDFATFHHLEMEITDVDGGKLPLQFHTAGRGIELAPAKGTQSQFSTQNVAYLSLGIPVSAMRILG